MPRPASEHPTERELDILKVLWDESPLPVRHVRARLAEQIGSDLSHSTVITLLNIMVRKKYVRRRKRGNAFLFSAAVERDRVTGGMMGNLLAKVFDNSPSAMVLNLIETAELDAEELAALRRLIRQQEKKAEEK
jgi:BlaI family transcriptional regulator, penicillinase repressor